jgi:hypothetical protein
MLESYTWFETQTPDALAKALTGLIRDIRHVLVHPDLRLDQKILAVFALVDAAAPPPPAGRPAERDGDRAGEATALPPGASTVVTRSPAL